MPMQMRTSYTNTLKIRLRVISNLPKNYKAVMNIHELQCTAVYGSSHGKVQILITSHSVQNHIKKFLHKWDILVAGAS